MASLGSTGLILDTQTALVTQYTAVFQAIYGSDIVLSSDSPDGQWMNILIQQILDLEDLMMQIYNSFDPDTAIGTQLDQRVAINGIQRQAGTNTIQSISIVIAASCTLYGLDQTANIAYTVQDAAGNQYQLQTTIFATAGTITANFQALVPGAVSSAPNTITVPVTIVLGVTSVNNPTTYTTLGINEESDGALRIRRQKSVSLSSQGYLQGLLAALLNIPGVTFAAVYENTTGTTNVAGVPGHSIWVIVAGSGSAANIANAIYTKRNAGCGMFGAISYTITQVDGTTFTVLWDDVVVENLFISFTASSINGVNPPNIAAIRSGLVTGFVPGVFAEVNINALATAVQAIDSNTLVTSAGFSLGAVQIATLSGVGASGSFEVSYNGNSSAAINWNDAIGTIQTKVQAISGLSAATVTGSIASQTLTFTIPVSVLGLITVTANTLMTSSPTAITFSFNEGYANTLSPTSQKYQFAVASANIIILPMILSPTTVTVVNTTGMVAFAGLGGYGTLTYSILTNLSGGSIVSGTGVYTAGSSPNVQDIVKVVDAFGNSATATVTVT